MDRKEIEKLKETVKILEERVQKLEDYLKSNDFIKDMVEKLRDKLDIW